MSTTLTLKKNHIIHVKSFEQLKSEYHNRGLIESESFPLNSVFLTAQGLMTPLYNTPLKIAESGIQHLFSECKMNLHTFNEFTKKGLQPELFTAVNEFLNQFTNKKMSKLILRHNLGSDEQPVVVGVPSSSYGFLDEGKLLDEIDMDTFDFQKGVIGDILTRIKFVSKKLMTQPKKDDVIRVGFEIANSNTRSRSLSVSGTTERLWCSNGCTSTHYDLCKRYIHRWGNDGFNWDKFRSDQNVVTSTMAGIAEKIPQLVGKISSADIVKQELEKSEKILGKRMGNKLDLATYFGDSGVEAYELWNRINALPHEITDEERKIALEEQSFNFLKKLTA